MKKLLFILLVNALAWQTGSAQSGFDIYLICSSLPRDNITEGIGRFENPRGDNHPKGSEDSKTPVTTTILPIIIGPLCS